MRFAAMVVTVMLITVMTAAGLAAPGGAAPVATEPEPTPGLHCTVEVVDQLATGELVTAPMRCEDRSSADAGQRAGVARMAPVLAVHYVHLNFGGASLTVEGGACNGGWLNLPAGWINVISSTWSLCTTQHYDLFNLTGSVEVLGPGGGNLSALHDRTNSVRYT